MKDGPDPSVSGDVAHADVGVAVSFGGTADDNGDWAITFIVPPGYPGYDVPDFLLTAPGAPPATPIVEQPTFTGRP